MDENISPFAANMAWTVSLSDRHFVGKDKLDDQQGQLVGLILEKRGVMRAKQRVLNSSEEAIGEITSGTFSPTLQQSIAMARIRGDIQSEYSVDIRGKLVNAQVVSLPFVRNGQAVYKNI